ncbi:MULTISPECIES: AfsR/SARP family transcriptional regulator [Nonomuraea]|uniref:AfsR/SARP family transcriptional regulator n=1 Tax=Nonomuraea salmonea TaxID=46181 RepID=A0ABV5NEU7_9ACTN
MEFRLLGPVEAWSGRRTVPLDGAKLRTVLAALLFAEGRPLSDQRMSYLLWGEQPPTTPGAQICTYVSRLRHRLRKGSLEITREGSGYQLVTGQWEVDHRKFQTLADQGARQLGAGEFIQAESTLRRALALWRGPALCDVTGQLSAAELPGLEESRRTVLERHIDARLALGMHVELVPELTGLVSEDALREGLRTQLMIALYRCGRPADALQVYQQGREILAEHLGVAPGEELRRVHQAILTGDSGLDHPDVLNLRGAA